MEQVGSGQSRFGYTGEQTDPTGLVYLRARYYHPAIGRFLTADSLIPDPLNSQGWNRYAYVGNNPINWIDPNGQTVRPPFSLCLFGKDPETGKCKDPFPGFSGFGTVQATNPSEAILKLTLFIGIGICLLVAGEQVLDAPPDTIIVPRPQSESNPTPTIPVPQRLPTVTQDYQVRVQIQGKRLSVGAAGASITLTDTSPIRANAAIEALDTLFGGLPRTDKKLVDQAVGSAKTWIRRVAAAGGVGPRGSKSFNNRGVSRNDARVDVEVLRGERNLVP